MKAGTDTSRENFDGLAIGETIVSQSGRPAKGESQSSKVRGIDRVS